MSATTRRTFLALGSLVAAGAAGGIAIGTAALGSPALSGPRPVRPPSPTPTPPPRLAEGIELSAGLLAAARAAEDDHPLVAQLVRDHAAQLAALRSPEPAARPAQPTPGTEPPAPRPGRDPLRTLIEAERAAVDAYAGWAGETTGGIALVWGSLAAHAAGAAGALRSSTRRAESPAPGTGPAVAVDDTTALQQVVAQSHAAIFGYQRLLALVPRGESEPVDAGLKAYRGLRDDLTAALADRGAAAPAAAPAYRTEGSAEEIGRQIESGALPYLGQWLQAAAEPASATAALREATGRALGWGAALPAWPGWPG
ncbi:hypothetical protein GGQ54_002797 [Naumannella cuiyingiana]|uniref:DUF4439 domain-containing protein n=1 Tax=Naumannella cuiyingiana TaxID=1347891 RepID=A0A7Z0DBB3_9ACTN|nr:hypothetical protein [Naumannella cuiyingiana]